MDEPKKEFMDVVICSWMVFSLCGAGVKAEKMLEYTTKLHLKSARIGGHGKTTSDRSKI